MILAALGVLAFSATLPGTAWALDGFGPWTAVGLRGILAAALAGACLLAGRVSVPRGRVERRELLVVAIGSVVGFPLFTTLALTTSTASHSAVIVGALPMATAVIASVWRRTPQSAGFWVAAGLGASVVMTFAVTQSHGSTSLGDLYVIIAVLLCGLGYAAGGHLARTMPGWQVIAWAVIASLPFSLVALVYGLTHEGSHVTTRAIIGLAYIAAISQFGGFVVWYRGMALIGVPRASQLQLAQPLLTVTWAWLLLGEHITPGIVVAALAVIACIVVAQRAGR